jgi:hypothetical protein
MSVSGLGSASSARTTHESPGDISSKPNAKSIGNELYVYTKDKKNAPAKLTIIQMNSLTLGENESRKEVENKLSKSGSFNKSAQRVLSHIKSWAKDQFSNSSGRKADFGGQSLVIKEPSERKVSFSAQNQNIESSSSSGGSVTQTAQLKSAFSLGDLKDIDDMISDLNNSKKSLTTASTTTVYSTTENNTSVEKSTKAVIEPSDQDIDDLLNFIDGSANTKSAEKSAIANASDQELDALLDDLDVLVKKQDSEKPTTKVKSKEITELDNLFDELEQLLDKKKPEPT